MLDRCQIWLPNADFTASTGRSLAKSLYKTPLTITLTGDLGAGKTTFLQGFLANLGVEEAVSSPTYALEQRYETPLGTVSHIDLYRLDEAGAKRFLAELDDDAVIRCVEWPERAGIQGDIHCHLEEDVAQAGRNLSVSFQDMPLPQKRDIDVWRDEVGLPPYVTSHCETVADVTTTLTEELLKAGNIVRPLAARRAAEVHDLLRFIDFRPGAGPAGETLTENFVWNEYKAKYQDIGHEAACASFLEQRGYMELAEIVKTHGMRFPMHQRKSIEQKLLFYADKRVAQDATVSLEERFEDICNRYTEGKRTAQGDAWFAEARLVEQELFPLGPIDL